MTTTGESTDKQMRLRYTGVCRFCGLELAAKTTAIYERSTKTVRCVVCPTAAESAADSAFGRSTYSTGFAGSSAQDEYERRSARREAWIRSEHPRTAGLRLRLGPEPTSMKNWSKGAIGEYEVGQLLDSLSSPSFWVLHDRAVPGSRANIDHIVVTQSGILVIDPKNYAGRPRRERTGGVFNQRVTMLRVGRRDQTKLVDQMLGQIDTVRNSLHGSGFDMPISGMLCFVGSDWPLFGSPFSIKSVEILGVKHLKRRLTRIPEAGNDLQPVAELLARALPPN